MRQILAELGIADAEAARTLVATTLGRRGGIPTYLDNRMLEVMRGDDLSASDTNMLSAYLRRLLGRQERFLSWPDRQAQLSGLPADTELDFRSMLYSQGAGEPFAWRGLDCFKTIYELALYPMMLSEIRPRAIVELGAGVGGSAAWFLDTCTGLGLDTVVHAVDLQAEDRTEARLRTSRRDCIQWLQDMAEARDALGSPLLVIEDFHGDLGQTLAALDDFLRPGDYLVIEDAIPKQAAMARALQDRPYVVDTRYTDFFGLNCTSAINGILKRV